jgi:polysaccharide export outer membrane protein
LPWFRAVICAGLVVLSLAACSSTPLGRDVIAQANPDGRIAFDIVKLDDAVLATLLAHPPAAFPERFKQAAPPPALKIGPGDLVSVVIFESASNGLFGESLTEISLPPGAVARRALTPATPPLGNVAAALAQLSTPLELSARLSGDFATQRLNPLLPDLGALPGGVTGQAPGGGLGQLPAGAEALASVAAGGALAQGLAGVAPQQSLAPGSLPAGMGAPNQAAPDEQLARRRLATENADSRNLEALLEAAVQTGRPGTRIPDQQVGSDGGISVPYAGRIAAAGHTPEEVARTIEQRLGPKALDPQAVVAVRRNRANSVSVTGEVIRGAQVPLSPGGLRLLQVIAVAGGARAPVHETFVRLSRGGATATVPLATLVANPDQDIFAEPGDVLTLVRQPQTFSVFGATGKNSAITFNSEKLSLTEALAKAGGLLDDRADPSAVFLFRYEPVNVVRALGQPIATDAPPGVSPVVYRLDLREAKSYLLARRFPVRDKDIIFVADSESRPVYRFFSALSNIVGPVETVILTCANSSC